MIFSKILVPVIFITATSSKLISKKFEKYSDFFIKNQRLYNMPVMDDCIDGIVKKPLGEMIQRLWQTVELQAIHIKTITDRMNDLEMRSKRGR